MMEYPKRHVIGGNQVFTDTNMKAQNDELNRILQKLTDKLAAQATRLAVMLQVFEEMLAALTEIKSMSRMAWFDKRTVKPIFEKIHGKAEAAVERANKIM